MTVPGETTASRGRRLAPSPHALAALPAAPLVQLERNPALVYLAALAPSGRRTMASALRQAAELLSPGRDYDAASFPWPSITYAHMTALRSVLAAKYAPATCNKTLAAVRGVCRESWRLGVIDAETFARVRDVPSVKGTRLPAGREVPLRELAALFRACAAAGPSGVRDAAAMALLYGAGLRRAEAVALDVDAFNCEAIRVLGKGNRERLVPLGPGALAALRAWLELRGPKAGPLLCRVNRGGRVELRAMTAGSLMRALERRRVEADAGPGGAIPHLSPHDLRRSYLTGLLRAGADLSTVQRLAGHASVVTTTLYDRRGAAEQLAAVQLLAVPFVPSKGNS